MSLSSLHTTLSYPLYTSDFDPLDATRLFVGGGGGAGRTGVGNKISLLHAAVAPTTSLAAACPLHPPSGREERSEDLRVIGEHDLGLDQDSVSSLAVARRSLNTTRGRRDDDAGDAASYLFAGANSSPSELKKGKNEHLRVFSVIPNANDDKEHDKNEIRPLYRASLLSASDPEEYQRIIRLASSVSPQKRASRLGTVASGLGRDNQLVVFRIDDGDLATAQGRASDAVAHLLLDREANDVDLIAFSPEDIATEKTSSSSSNNDKNGKSPEGQGLDGDVVHRLLFCDNHHIYLSDIPPSANTSTQKITLAKPHVVYEVPPNPTDRQKSKKILRSLRFLTPNFVLAALNKPRRSGVELVVFRLPPASASPSPTSSSSKSGRSETTARVAAKFTLPSHVAMATALVVRNIAPFPLSPNATSTSSPNSAPVADQQEFLLAVAGHDASISLLQLKHQVFRGVELLYDFLPLLTIKNTHPLQITSLALSPPIAAVADATTTTTKSGKAVDAWLHLASTSMGNTVAVHRIPLSRTTTSLPKHPKKTKTKTKTHDADADAAPQRFTVALEPKRPGNKMVWFVLTVIVVVMAVLGQGLLESLDRDLTPDILGVRDVLPSLPFPWLAKPRGDVVGTGHDGIAITATQDAVVSEDPTHFTPPGDDTLGQQHGSDGGRGPAEKEEL